RCAGCAVATAVAQREPCPPGRPVRAGADEVVERRQRRDVAYTVVGWRRHRVRRAGARRRRRDSGWYPVADSDLPARWAEPVASRRAEGARDGLARLCLGL